MIKYLHKLSIIKDYYIIILITILRALYLNLAYFERPIYYTLNFLFYLMLFKPNLQYCTSTNC